VRVISLLHRPTRTQGLRAENKSRTRWQAATSTLATQENLDATHVSFAVILAQQYIVIVLCAMASGASQTFAARQMQPSAIATSVFNPPMTTGFAAAVYEAAPCGTSYRFNCTAGAECGSITRVRSVNAMPHNGNVGNGAPLTSSQFDAFVGASLDEFRMFYETTTNDTLYFLDQWCTLQGKSSSAAVCTNTLLPGSSATEDNVYLAPATITSNPLPFATFPITAGADLLATATGSCTLSNNAPDIANAILGDGTRALMLLAISSLLTAGMLV
jgi:hypothetical protein